MKILFKNTVIRNRDLDVSGSTLPMAREMDLPASKSYIITGKVHKQLKFDLHANRPRFSRNVTLINADPDPDADF
jgi:hypothetical protein